MTDDLPMTRARLYVLIDAFERDVRSVLSKYVVDEIGEKAALGPFYAPCVEKQDRDTAAVEGSLVSFLEMREGYDLLNTHRARLPMDLATEVRELTGNLDRLVAIRNRVMHARPLAPGDSDAAVSLLSQYTSPYWRETTRTLAQLHNDPTWEPLVTPGNDESATLHNLPLPDYDDTGLVGRSREVDDLVALLKRGREPVITVTGEGGIGKTALALEVAYRLVDDGARPFDAVLWTSLKFEKLTAFGVREISGAARDLIGAIRPLGTALESGFEGTVRELADLLEGFKVLLVIDNLETIAGHEFKGLYDALPDTVTYLVTSRVGVGEYERRYPLGVLTDRDSVQLFNQFVRARQISALSRLSNETRAEVVRQLRYSPLAIKWFALAVEAGKEPLRLLREQDDLLEFCVRSVYDGLAEPAREVLDALAVLARPLTSDELIVLLDRTVDDINVAVQELARGSLVRRESGGNDSDLVLQILLTETATQFLGRRVATDEARARMLRKREREFREVQERRAADIADRLLAPVVVRQRTDADAPTCTLLRQALLAAKKRETDLAFEKIDLARRMNPDFWEVDRVEGFIRDSVGDLSAATACYERAYENASGESRAVVAHFFAGHLARKVRDIKRAIGYAREAHEALRAPDTAVALGNYLVWSHQFEQGIAMIEPAVPESRGRGRLIAISALAEGWRRWAEATKDEERNPLLQSERAWKGFVIAVAAFESGVSDDRLRDTAAECAAVFLSGAVGCARAGIPLTNASERFTRIGTTAVRLAGCRAWGAMVNEARRLGETSGAPIAAKRLRGVLDSLSQELGDALEVSVNGEPIIGEVVRLSGEYGFIRHPAFPNNIFFHRTGVLSDGGIAKLSIGSLVKFRTFESERGPRAEDIFVVTS